MRLRHALAPLAVIAALLAGCGAQDNGAQDNGAQGSDTPSAAAPGGETTPADNGVAALPAEEILTRARAALAGAKSFHLIGAGREAQTDLRVSGKDFAGAPPIGKLKIVSIGNDVYISDGDNLRIVVGAALPANTPDLTGKYLKVDATSSTMAAIKKYYKSDDLSGLAQLRAMKGSFTKGAAKTFDGVPAIGLVDAASKGTLYVATRGEPYPIRVEFAEDSDSFVTLTEFNAPIDLKPPPAADVIALTR